MPRKARSAIGALRSLREAGFIVPDDVSLIGCDDIPVAAQLQPALTTVWQPKRELGLLAVKLILRQIETQQVVRRIGPTGGLGDMGAIARQPLGQGVADQPFTDDKDAEWFGHLFRLPQHRAK